MGKTKIFRVVGTSYRQDNLEKIVYENEDYDLTTKQIIDQDLTDERIYQFTYNSRNVELIPEPDNEYDPNAIKVMASNVHIGYIEAKETATVKDLLASGTIDHMTVIAEGGKYKYVSEDDDEEFQTEEGETNLFADLYIAVSDSEEEPVQGKAASKGTNILVKILLIVLAVMSLLLSIVYPIMLVVVAACIYFIIRKPKK